MKRAHAWFAASAIGFGFFSAESLARADEKQACVTASDEAQKLRDERKLVKSREQLLLCARDVCPGVVRKDCSQWLSEVEASLPSVTLSARDASGKDITSARVSLDGAPLTDKLDGKALFVDPGPHAFKFEVQGKPAVEQQMIVREGERNRAVTAVFGGDEAQPLTQTGNTAPPAEPERKKTPVVGYVVAGAGVLALGGATFFWLTGKSDLNGLKNGCGVPAAGQMTGHCDQKDVDAVKSKLLVGDILAGVGIVAVGVGAYLIITGSTASSAKVGMTQLNIQGVPGGGVAQLAGRF